MYLTILLYLHTGIGYNTFIAVNTKILHTVRIIYLGRAVYKTVFCMVKKRATLSLFLSLDSRRICTSSSHIDLVSKLSI